MCAVIAVPLIHIATHLINTKTQQSPFTQKLFHIVFLEPTDQFSNIHHFKK